MNRLLAWIRRATLRDWIRLIKKALPHAAIIIAGMLIVFFLIDRVNKPMGFMTNEFHKVLTFILALLALYFAVQLIAVQRQMERADYRRRLKAYEDRYGAPPMRTSSPARSMPARPAPARPVSARPAPAPVRRNTIR